MPNRPRLAWRMVAVHTKLLLHFWERSKQYDRENSTFPEITQFGAGLQTWLQHWHSTGVLAPSHCCLLNRFLISGVQKANECGSLVFTGGGRLKAALYCTLVYTVSRVRHVSSRNCSRRSSWFSLDSTTLAVTTVGCHNDFNLHFFPCRSVGWLCFYFQSLQVQLNSVKWTPSMLPAAQQQWSTFKVPCMVGCTSDVVWAQTTGTWDVKLMSGLSQTDDALEDTSARLIFQTESLKERNLVL